MLKIKKAYEYEEDERIARFEATLKSITREANHAFNVIKIARRQGLTIVQILQQIDLGKLNLKEEIILESTPLSSVFPPDNSNIPPNDPEMQM